MPDADCAGVPTHWRVFGAGEVQALALHCTLAHSGAWAGMAAELPGLTLTAPDMLGHGRSGDWDGAGDFHTRATQQAIALMGRMGDAPLHLIGHSFGATVALRIALELPERVASLSLFEPVLFCAARAAEGPEFAAHEAMHEPYATALMQGDSMAAAASFQAIWGRGQPFDHTPPAQRAYIAARVHLIAAQNETLLRDAAGMLAYGRLEGLGIPVLLAQGAESPAIIDAINRELARRLPQVQRATVAKAGHMLPITHAAECAELVRAFMPG
ncbi:alpha/beta fold hydrolase [Pseudorhodobacter sp.]|uniref:alpha/beta fold hydrolase n=1 Tax=Pseudorhodobacter sp. TaxID=1934400 RepID=UPI0026473384|nr:alpha/beta fold hydrolase [Pseudorhodobacter sp.]MDN5788762.1 alpha/beta hydrolase [Pseudorhodobacter sp.]